MGLSDSPTYCARSACNGSPAEYFNSSTLMYYCKRCAMRINDENGVVLCEHDDVLQERWITLHRQKHGHNPQCSDQARARINPIWRQNRIQDLS